METGNRWLATAAALLCLAITSCATNDSVGDDYFESEHYRSSGEEFWDGWIVPEDTVQIGPMVLSEDGIGTEFLVLGDPVVALNDMWDQMEERNYPIEVPDYSNNNCWYESPPNRDSRESCESIAVITGENSSSVIVRVSIGGEEDHDHVISLVKFFYMDDRAAGLRGRDHDFGTTVDRPHLDTPSGLRTEEIREEWLGGDFSYAHIGEIPDTLQLLAPDLDLDEGMDFRGMFVPTGNEEEAIRDVHELADFGPGPNEDSKTQSEHGHEQTSTRYFNDRDNENRECSATVHEIRAPEGDLYLWLTSWCR